MIRDGRGHFLLESRRYYICSRFNVLVLEIQAISPPRLITTSTSRRQNPSDNKPSSPKYRLMAAYFDLARVRLKRKRTKSLNFSRLIGNSPNLVPRAFSSTIFKMADRREKTLAKAGITWYKISKNLGDFLSHDILRKAKTKWRRSIAWEAKHRSKNALTLYTRQWWLRSKIKYYFNGCFDSGAGLFSICKFIPLSHSLYNFVITVTEIRLNIKENKYRVKKRTLCGLI